jgi:hypothetical protein
LPSTGFYGNEAYSAAKYNEKYGLKNSTLDFVLLLHIHNPAYLLNHPHMSLNEHAPVISIFGHHYID